MVSYITLQYDNVLGIFDEKCIQKIYSLFVSCTHKIFLHFIYIKYFNMSNNLAVITQDEFEPNILPNSNLTMASLPMITKKKFVQRAFYFGKRTHPKMAAPTKATRKIRVPQHKRGCSQISGHTRTVKDQKDGNKKEGKSRKIQKKKPDAKKNAFAKEDCKESVRLAKQIDIEQRWEYVKKFKK
jgi:hypothetical protein